MDRKSRWEERQMVCPEEKRQAKLLVEWRQEEGNPVIHSIQCDNPRLSALDNWDCQWSCWGEILRQEEG